MVSWLDGLTIDYRLVYPISPFFSEFQNASAKPHIADGRLQFLMNKNATNHNDKKNVTYDTKTWHLANRDIAMKRDNEKFSTAR